MKQTNPSLYDIADPPVFQKPDVNNDVKTMKQQEVERFGKDTKLRKTLAVWTMVIISVWLASVLFIICFQTDMAPEVLITLLATTTLNVLGLPKIILEGLFGNVPRKNRNSSK